MQQTTTAPNELKHTSAVGVEAFCTLPVHSHHTLSRHAAFCGVLQLDSDTRPTRSSGTAIHQQATQFNTFITANSACTTVEGGHEHTPAKAVHRVMQATNAPLAQDDPEIKHTLKQLEITMWHNKNSLHKAPASTPLHSKHKASRSLCQQSKNKS